MTMTKRKYSKPELLRCPRYLLDEPTQEASADDITDAERLRPLYLLSQRADLTPVATRVAIRGDRRRGDWQKVFSDLGTVVESEQEALDGTLYFLGFVPGDIPFSIELQTRGPDAKTRIAVANEVSVPSGGRLGLLVLSKKHSAASFALSM
jgi:hypothetical protein